MNANLDRSINRTIRRYYAFSFLENLHFFSAVLVPFFTDWGHITQAEIQLLQSWFMLWIFLLEIPTGAVADLWGRKYSLALGCFVLTIGIVFYGSFSRFEMFLLAEFLFACGVALVSGANQALLYDALKEAGREEQSSAVFGRAATFELAGRLVAAPIGSWIAAKYGLNAPLLFSAIPVFVAACVALSIKEPVVYERTSERIRYLQVVRKGSFFFYRHKTLRILAVDALSVAIAGYFIIWLYQPLLKVVGMPIAYFGLIHVGLVGSEMLVSSNFARLERLFGSGERLLKCSALFVAIVFLLVAWHPNIVTILVFIMIGGGLGITRLQLMLAYMNKIIPSKQRATVLSSISMFRRFALVIVNPVIGYAASYSLNLALLIVGLIPLGVYLFSPVRQNMLEGDE